MGVWCVIYENPFCYCEPAGYSAHETLVAVCATEEIADKWISERQTPQAHEAREWDVLGDRSLRIAR